MGGSHTQVESDEDDEAAAVQAALLAEREAVANAAAARHVELNARREAGKAAQLAKAAAKHAGRGLPCD